MTADVSAPAVGPIAADLPEVRQALMIRLVEDRLLELFAQGRLNGTVHTSSGQEFSAVAFAGALDAGDFVWSNHRCHGHYLAFTGDTHGLIAELMGRAGGTCGGIGGSQHLCGSNFYSSGVQGGIVPVAAGMALAAQLRLSPTTNPRTGPIGVVFIGDGTLGEGVVYETLNMLSLWSIPLLVVCEDNGYAQSTPRDAALAGGILARAEAFGIRTAASTTWDPQALLAEAQESIQYVREQRRPLFHLVGTYRLNAHSSSDDLRDPAEVAAFRAIDPLERHRVAHPQAHEQLLAELQPVIEEVIAKCAADAPLPVASYLATPRPPEPTRQWVAVQPVATRQVELLNRFFHQQMERDERILFIGEDVHSPYGGAFKVARGLSQRFPNQVITTPISEAAITGIAGGLALGGFKPFVEIMFGDFVTLAMDQIVNHAAKFHSMYHGQVDCPLVIRTPMGGGRGYGPTHSQTLDRLVTGIHDVTTVALNVFLDPAEIYEGVLAERNPVIVIENKTDYGLPVGGPTIPNYQVQRTVGAYPVVRIRPLRSRPDTTVVTYGGIAGRVAQAVNRIFVEHERLVEVIVVSRLHPTDWAEVVESVTATGRLVVVEEGTKQFGLGSEVIARVAEALPGRVRVRHLGAANLPIPSAAHLEGAVLPSVAEIVSVVAGGDQQW